MGDIAINEALVRGKIVDEALSLSSLDNQSAKGPRGPLSAGKRVAETVIRVGFPCLC